MSGKKTTKRKAEKAKRFRVARSDASVGSIQAAIEDDFGLPGGSVKLVRPSGKRIRSDATIETLLRQWNT